MYNIYYMHLRVTACLYRAICSQIIRNQTFEMLTDFSRNKKYIHTYTFIRSIIHVD